MLGAADQDTERGAKLGVRDTQGWKAELTRLWDMDLRRQLMGVWCSTGLFGCVSYGLLQQRRLAPFPSIPEEKEGIVGEKLCTLCGSGNHQAEVPLAACGVQEPDGAYARVENSLPRESVGDSQVILHEGEGGNMPGEGSPHGESWTWAREGTVIMTVGLTSVMSTSPMLPMLN